MLDWSHRTLLSKNNFYLNFYWSQKWLIKYNGFNKSSELDFQIAVISNEPWDPAGFFMMLYFTVCVCSCLHIKSLNVNQVYI